ncbi:metallopeptidase family protein [Zavarzinia compransoris]|uniref:Neutral zinc metallopeptidase n=1 Tax=Zavarzinia compransoris TaxID=1264899 RepID=A0A317E9D9_9PROT|nr:metallopeptidase family protein [Zavarzinia compransoris]PWR21943.1 neutral zinc metallopeptidase [Zavarzinia compransoris]TDP47320.1 putative Zn-dependent protease with MMP-like domain [Zavarzinia compransoris]
MTHAKFLDRLLAPSLEDIEALAAQALAEIPPALRDRVRGIVIRVDEFADEETLEQMGIEDPFTLTGLYRGVPLRDKSVGDSGAIPDMIFLYRRPILDEWCETGATLGGLVREVLIHEIGHHFGFSDDDMDALD